MVKTATPAKPSPTVRPWRRHRFTDAEFDRMVRAGVFRAGSRAFLWGGEIVEPMAEDQPHLGVVSGLLLLLAARFPAADWTINVNQPVQIRRRYRPQPDLVVLRGPKSSWMARGRVPQARDVALLVEVSDTSLAVDSGDKLRKYAGAAIDPYWIVNIPELRVEVRSRPVPEESRYLDLVSHGPGEVVPLFIQAEVGRLDVGGIPVDEILAGLVP
jgi:Uma2 family endonuclease